MYRKQRINLAMMSRQLTKEIVQLNVVQDSFEPNDQCKVQRDCNDFVQYEPLVNPTDHSKTIPDDMPIAFVKSSFVPSVSEYTEHINEQHETNFDTTSCTIRNEHSYTASLQSVDNSETMPSMRITAVTSLYGPDVSECTEFSNVPEHSESDSEIESQQNELIAEKKSDQPVLMNSLVHLKFIDVRQTLRFDVLDVIVELDAFAGREVFEEQYVFEEQEVSAVRYVSEEEDVRELDV